ncbi:hypothetical protein ABKA04_008844 [Annulohypoxylon sp. FPYF3050]
MSTVHHPGRDNPRVMEKVFNQFPKWAAAITKARQAMAVDDDDGHSQFAITSNWVLRSEGLRELFDGLKKEMEGVQITYNSNLSTINVRCLASEQDSVMAKCQTLMNGIVRRELNGDSATPKQAIAPMQWREISSESEKKKSIMAVAPSDIRGSVFQTVWIVPDTLVHKGVVMSRLLTTRMFAKLQQLTGCAMAISGDGRYMYIGAESEGQLLMAERKLTTLAKYAAIPSEADSRCESFIYAESEQDSLAKFTHLVHGSKATLKTFYIDRMFCPQVDSISSYGRLFERGAVVSLVDDDHTPIAKGISATPVTREEERSKPYGAFPLDWKYRAKEAYPDTVPSVPYDPNSLVTSWINKLPTPGQMLPHGDDTDSLYPDSGISANGPKRGKGDGGERSIAQQQIDEQRRKLLPHSIGQVVPTLPKSIKPPQPQEGAHEQRNEVPRHISQALPIPSESSQEVVQETNTSSGNQVTTSGGGRDDIGQNGRVNGRQNSFQVEQRGRGSRGNRGRGNRGRGDRGRGDRGRGNRGRGYCGYRGSHSNRGNRGTRGGYDAQGPARRQQRPIEEPSLSSSGAVGHISDLTPSRFTEILQQDPQGQVDNSTSFSDPNSSGYSPPHGSQTRATTQTSQDACGVCESRPKDVDSDESNHGPTLKQLKTRINTLKLVDATKSQSEETQPIHRGQNGDVQARDSEGKVAHSTMKQQGSARPTRGNAFVSGDSAPELIAAMSQKIARMMSSLEVYSGNILLKAQIGRFCITKFSPVYVQNQDKGKPLQNIKEALDKHHTDHRDLLCTNILTAEGTDANYMGLRTDRRGKRVWRSDNRRTVYQVFCAAAIMTDKEVDFVVEIDGSSFTYQIRHEDFQGFAKDLVRGMWVEPQASGVPIVGFTINNAYGAEILTFRVCNIASYDKPNTSDIMEIREVHDMLPNDFVDEDGTGKGTVHFSQRPEFKERGELATWYEVSLQSKKVNEALQQNRDLELGEVVDWSPKELQEAGAFDELVRSAIEVVKNIDGVGYWGDNDQDTMIHGMPQVVSTRRSQMGSTANFSSVW